MARRGGEVVWRARAKVAAAALVLCGALAACSSGSTDGEPNTAGTDAAPATDASASTDPDDSDELGWVVAFSPEEYGPSEQIIATSTDGAEWSEVGSAPILTALDDGPDGWLGVDYEGTVHASDDLARWDEVARLGDSLTTTDLAFGDGRFVAVGGTVPADPDVASEPLIFSSTDGVDWQASEVPALQITGPSPGSPDHVLVQHVTYADEVGFIAHAANPAAVGTGGDAVTLTSSDGESWEVVGEPHAGNLDSAAGGGTIVTGILTGEVSEDQQLRLGGLATRTAPADTLTVVSDSPFEQRPLSSVAFGDDQFLALAAESFNEGTGSSAHGVFLSTDGRSWDEVAAFDGYVEALAFGSIADVEPREAAGIRDIDWTSRSYSVCDETITLVDDRWTSPDGSTVISLDDVLFGDADGDGDEDALLVFSCAPVGGNAYPNVVNLVFTVEGDVGEPTQLGDAFAGNQATIVDGGVQTVDPVWAEGDPRSTPSGSRTTMWRYEDGTWVPTVIADDTPVTDPAPTTAPPSGEPGADGDLPQVRGYGPVGSGCSPGAGSLPDGWWFGFAASTPAPGGTFDLDLACYSYEEMADVEHGHDDVVVTNDNPAVRGVRVADGATFSCSTILDGREQPCDGYVDPAVWVRIEGGVATKVVTQLWWE